MTAATKTRDTVASLLHYDVSDTEDGPFREIDFSIDKPEDGKSGTKRNIAAVESKETTDALGVDEEVRITKKRKPVAKLDEARLLSQLGIPKLRALARSGSISSKLRLKGKGHEYSDAAKLLGFYQLWLDDLYPRAKFADGLQLIEKVGHGKRMQVMRKEWIDEGKPGYGKDSEERSPAGTRKLPGGDQILTNEMGKQPDEIRLRADMMEQDPESLFDDLDEALGDDLFFYDPKTGTTVNNDDLNEPAEDELDALLAEQTASRYGQPQPHDRALDEDSGDDLDALLAEQPARGQLADRSKQQEQSSSSVILDALDAGAEGGPNDAFPPT